MEWTDTGIIVSVRKLGESTGVVQAFTLAHGLHSGAVSSIQGKQKRGVYQPGNIVTLTWKARLPEQMGNFRGELHQSIAAEAMQDAAQLAALSTMTTLLSLTMQERDPHPNLYRQLHDWLGFLAHNTGEWLADYVKLELLLLAECGFGLDLRACAATGATDELIYVSPKTGRAVSREAGKPYCSKLLPLPDFLNPHSLRNSPPDMQEILDGMRLSGYFLEHWLLEPYGKKIPAVRGRLEALMQY